MILQFLLYAKESQFQIFLLKLKVSSSEGPSGSYREVCASSVASPKALLDFVPKSEQFK